jgi:hypothetical protein
MVTVMKMDDTVLAIASRHFADSDEGGRTCHACGLPWPCDVRQIIAVLAITPQATTRTDGPTTNAARPLTLVASTRSRRRAAPTPTTAS